MFDSSLETRCHHAEMRIEPPLGEQARPNSRNMNFPSPEKFKSELPSSPKHLRLVEETRESIRAILRRLDHRWIVVIGPCSIHDTQAGIDYSARLRKLSDQVSDTFLLVMRAYLEKPRTIMGWKGLINDPFLDQSFRVDQGIRIAREFLLRCIEQGTPLATEFLDPITPQYLQDLVSWSAIGARTAESQTHREMASGVPCPVGFKNSTDGSFTGAINALQSVISQHRYLGISQQGRVAILQTAGNFSAHIVLRGGFAGPNYSQEAISNCEFELGTNGLDANIMIDCSHENCLRDYRQQSNVAHHVASQIIKGNQSIIGIMIESNISEGNQPLGDPGNLRYGQSITDPCIGWAETERLLLTLRRSLQEPLRIRQSLARGLTA